MTDDVTIVLASIILREVNEHKDTSKGGIRNRVKNMSEKFNNILLKNRQSRVPLLHCCEIPVYDDEKAISDLTEMMIVSC